LPPHDHRPPALELIWQQLAGEARQAYRAAFLLAREEQAVAFLEQRLRRVEPVKPQRIGQLVDDLDHESFAKREAASAELARLGFQAETALRKALAGSPSVEARARLTRLLRPLDSCFISDPVILREVRAIGVLRRIGSPAARTLLQRLAEGAPEAVQTRAALTALRAIKQAAR
jgi:hypothetical protein